MPIAIVVVFISRQPTRGEMCRRTVVGAHRTRSSKRRLSGLNPRTGLNDSPGTGETRLNQSLLAAAAQEPDACLPSGFLVAAALSHRSTGSGSLWGE